MAETTQTPEYTSLGDTKLDSYYQSFLKTLPNQQISYNPVQYEEQTVEGIAGQVEKYLRNYYDKSISDRQVQTKQQNAALDVDAASRGMSASTFLSDMKNRQYMAEAADIANLNSDYNATLAQTVQDQYNNYLANKLNVDFNNRQNQLEVDKWNASGRLALEELAYQRALEAYKRAPSSGGGSSGRGSGGSNPPTSTWDAYYDTATGQWKVVGDVSAAANAYDTAGARIENGHIMIGDQRAFDTVFEKKDIRDIENAKKALQAKKQTTAKTGGGTSYSQYR